MRKILPLFLLIPLYLYTPLFAQQPCQPERYIHKCFDSIDTIHDIQFGVADDDLGNSVNLKLDVYQPAGDTLTRRPLVVMMFGGGFILGSKTDADMVAWCDSLASHGYVAVAPNYRIGMDPVLIQSAKRAIYRAEQDCRAAVRFLVENYLTYGIDTNLIYIGGESAGAITALNATFIDHESERDTATYSSILFPVDMGCIDCSGNSFHHAVNVKGIIDLWGAMTDTSFIETADSTALLMIHGTADAFVPYIEGYGFTVGYTFPYLYGSLRLNARASTVGLYHELYPFVGQPHLFYGAPSGVVTFPNQYWDTVFKLGNAFLYKTLQFPSPFPSGNVLTCAGSIETYIASGNAGSSYCWNVSGGTIVSSSGNTVAVEWGSSGTGLVNVIETNYNLVSGFVSDTLHVAVNICEAVKETPAESLFSIAPNPSSDHVTVNFNFGSESEAALKLFALNGKEALNIFNGRIKKGMQSVAINTQTLAPGVYLLELRTGKEVLHAKLVKIDE